MPFTAEDSRRWAKENIARICAEQGITVAITDPALIARSARILRVGKQRCEAARIKDAARLHAGSHEHVSDMST